MRAFCITLEDNPISQQGRNKLEQSSKAVNNLFNIDTMRAVVPREVKSLMRNYRLEWTWPWDEERLDPVTNIRMHPYRTIDPNKRIACALSHFLLWEWCAEQDESLLIFEHDSMFIRHFDPTLALNSPYQAIGINSPWGATRKAPVFNSVVELSIPDEFGCVKCPQIDNLEIAQGLAGNSAYLIKPRGAAELWQALRTHGAWPNDAIMCQQLFSWLGVTKTYYTQVQGLPSSTSL